MTANQKNRIRLLPEHLVDQIKAGEVIERPALLLKEIIENALDANSKTINIHIRENGLELISIEDDGDGILIDDLPYAFCRHATSKIERFEDLYGLHSFGFRGEALASIAAVSRLTCSSFPKGGESGGKIEIHGGEQKSLTPYHSSSSGTSIFIRDLFFNTPARLKFVKSKISEKNAINRVLNSFLFSHPQTTFSIKWDDKEKIFYPATDLKERVKKIMFKGKSEEVISFEKEYEGHKVEGFASTTSSKTYSGKVQYLFANKRNFEDRTLHMTIMRSMEPIWGAGSSGHYCLMISTPPNQIDVNVHPNKIQIKFLKNSLIYSLLSSAMKEAFLKNETQNSLPRNSKMLEEQPTHSSPSLDRFINNPMEENYSHNQDRQALVRNDWSIYIFDEHYALLKNTSSGENHLLSKPNLVASYLLKEFVLNGEAGEFVTPLLISEPFSFPRGTIDLHIPFLKEKGFDLERLEDNLIVLRSIPNYLTHLPIQGICQTIFSLLNKYKSLQDFQEALKRADFELPFYLSFSQIEQMREQFSVKQQNELGIIKVLHRSDLSSIFKK